MTIGVRRFQLLARIRPVHDVFDAHEIPQDSGPFGDWVAVFSDPPGQQIGQPARFGVGGGADVGLDAAHGSVARQHVPKLGFLEALQLVETDQGNLRA